MAGIVEKYAKLLVEYCLELKAGERVLINSSYLAEDLVRELYRQVLLAGAHPELKIGVEGIEKIFYDTANDQQLAYVSPLTEYIMNNFEAIVNVLAPFNMKELQNVPAEKKQKFNAARAGVNKVFMDRSATRDLKWNLCVWPTSAAAQEAGMSLAEYQDFVFGACLLHEEDPVQSWRQFGTWQQRITDALTGKDQIRFQGRDIDISFSAKGRKWINSAGTNNMPSGEVFTTPVEDSVNGHIRFSYPGIFMGEAIENIELEVKDGLVVGWHAAKGADLLDKVFDIPGARRFGEAAMGTNKRIDKFTRNMLFDEKIGGTVHMAVGAAIKETGGLNESSVHWDMLADMTDGGKIFADGELVYQDGEFLIGK